MYHYIIGDVQAAGGAGEKRPGEMNESKVSAFFCFML